MPSQPSLQASRKTIPPKQPLAFLDWFAPQVPTVKLRSLPTAIAINGKRDEKSFPARVISRTPALSRRARMRKPNRVYHHPPRPRLPAPAGCTKSSMTV
jgi:hypothetical protein